MYTIGRYQLHEKLGQGGMGTVYRAFDTLLERVVAVKIISHTIDESAEVRERFFREARAAGQLSHKNIITIYDLGEHEARPYLAMEFLEGEDLQRRLGGPERVSLAHKLDVALELCEGLEYAHNRHIVHRDIKPANIFITNRGTVKILDFGLARLVTSELTNSNMMMGTLNYMAPEQVRGERADNRSDVFSVGVVLYELLGGRKAFEGDSFASTMFKILQEVPQPLDTLDPTLPADVIAAVDRALAKPRDERYQTIGDMMRDLVLCRQALTPFDPGSGGTRRPSDQPRRVFLTNSDAATLPATPATPMAAPPVPTTPTPMPVPAASGSVWPMVGALASVLAVVGVGLLWVNGRQAPAIPSQPIRQQAAAPATLPARPSASPPGPQRVPPPPRTADPGKDTEVPAMSEAMRRAARAYAAQDYAAAQRYAEEVLRRDPSQHEALLLRERSRTAATRQRERRQSPAIEPSRPEPRSGPPPTPGTTSQPFVPPPTVAAPARPPEAPRPAPPRPPAGSSAAPPPAVQPETPAPKPAAPRAPADDPGVRAEDAVADLLGRYRAAIEARDLDALRRIWPTLGGDQLDAIRAEFQHARRIDVEVVSPHITTSDGTGSALFIRRYALMTTDGQMLRTDTRTTMNIRRTNAGWVIERMHFEPVR